MQSNNVVNRPLTAIPGKKEHRVKLLDIDRWDVIKLGLIPDTTHSSYYLDFSHIKQAWLKQATKKFILLQSATKSHSSCRSYIAAIMRLSAYLETLMPLIEESDINRSLMLNFSSYLLTKKYGIVTRRTTLVHLRTFHEIIIQENWLDWPQKTRDSKTFSAIRQIRFFDNVNNLAYFFWRFINDLR